MKVRGHLKVSNNLDLTDTSRSNDATIFTKSFSLESPTASEDVTLFLADRAATVTDVRGVLTGSSNPLVEFYIKFDEDRSQAGESVLGDGQQFYSTTRSQVFSPTGTGESIPENNWVWLETTRASGTVSEMHLTIKMKYD